MKTVVCLRHLHGSGGGPERLIRSIAKYIDPTRFTFVVVLWCHGDSSEDVRVELEQEGIRVEVLRHHRMNPCVLLPLLAILRKYEAQILHSNDPYCDIFGLIAARIAGCQAICSAHGFLQTSRMTRFREYIDKEMMRRFDRVIGGSQAMVDRLIRLGIEREKVSLVYNGVDLDQGQSTSKHARFRRRFGISSSAQIVGLIGRLSPEKGHGVFLEAIAHYQRYIPRARFVIAGEGPQRFYLESLTRHLAIQDRVVFTGYYPHLNDLLAEFDLFVLPSLRESLPVALLEAICHGVPVVASEVGGIAELIQTNRTGLLVPPGDSDALGQAMVELMLNRKKARRLAEAAQTVGLRDFSAQNMVQQMEGLYQAC